MNKADIIFYLSVLGLVWVKVSEQIKALVSGNVYAWLSVIFGAIAVVAFAFYEKINGTPPVPPAQ